MKDKGYLIEVVQVECQACGLLSNDITGWDCCYNFEDDDSYYLCPDCARETGRWLADKERQL